MGVAMVSFGDQSEMYSQGRKILSEVNNFKYEEHPENYLPGNQSGELSKTKVKATFVPWVNRRHVS